ncbi:MAG: manganese efflux pump, partial [Lentisphaeria bacterium]|nr:manganese efflux pump [Lentisphaeria bacterium]
ALLLAGIGGKMIWDSGKEEKVSFGIKALLLLAIATSIDAFLVGISFACLGEVHIIPEVTLIGITTFLISLGGCFGGRFSGRLLGSKCEVIGGLVLIALAVKTLILG